VIAPTRKPAAKVIAIAITKAAINAVLTTLASQSIKETEKEA